MSVPRTRSTIVAEAPLRSESTNKADGTRFVEQELPALIDHLAGRESAFSMIFVDVDQLTQINNRFGRNVGDAVLEIVYEQIRRRSAARYKGRCGDDTFYAVLFDAIRAERFCERLKQDISSYRWSVVAPALRVTCTLGYARQLPNETATHFILRSIYGLLEGKKSGGNSVQEGPRFLPLQPFIKLPTYERHEYHSPPGMVAEWAMEPLSLRKYFS
jgi:diguanylate cyclase (GGDEF)-like protein